MSIELLITVHTLGIAANTAWVIALMRKYYKLNYRLRAIEHAHYMREWLAAIESGESPSDLAYMKKNGFLK